MHTSCVRKLRTNVENAEGDSVSKVNVKCFQVYENMTIFLNVFATSVNIFLMILGSQCLVSSLVNTA